MPEIVRLHRDIITLALDVFGKREKANEWLRTPNNLLGDNTPFNHALTETGAQKVLGILRNMKDGLSY